MLYSQEVFGKTDEWELLVHCDPYSFENQLSCSEVKNVDDGDAAANDDDDDDNDNSYYYYYHRLLYAGYPYIYSWDKPCP